MKYTYHLTAIAAALLLLGAATAEAQTPPTVRVAVSADEIYEGQAIDYQVTVSGAEGASEPTIDFGDGFSSEFLGRQQLMQSHSRIVINGRVIEDSSGGGTAFVYRLTPRATGELLIPAPAVEIDGQAVRGTATRIIVHPADAQDTVRAWIEVDDDSVYPMQPFTVTFSVAVKAMPGQYAADDPTLALARANVDPPKLVIPWAVDERLPSGLAPARPWNEWLNGLLSRRGGFSVNDLKQQGLDMPRMPSMFGGSMFDDDLFGERVFTFLPRPRRVQLPDADDRMTDYWRYDFTRSFTPEKTGSFAFGPATVTGTFVAGEKNGKLVGGPIHAIARPITVTVQSPPTDGRPESYTGAIGRFRATASINPTNAAVGDPLTLTIQVDGRGTFDYIAPPDLTAIPAIADHFKIHDATEDRADGGVTFTYGLRALDTTPRELPAIPFTYFDVDSERFVTLQTDAIPLTIRPADRLSSGQIVGAPVGGGLPTARHEARADGVFANMADLSAVGDHRVSITYWLTGMGAIALGYVVTFVVVRRMQYSASDPRIRRKRNAAPRAKKKLQEGLDALANGRPHADGVDAIRQAITGFVADHEAIDAAGMTPKDVRMRLESRGVDEAVARQAVDLLEMCDGARYSGDAETAEIAARAPGSLDALIRELKKN